MAIWQKGNGFGGKAAAVGIVVWGLLSPTVWAGPAKDAAEASRLTQQRRWMVERQIKARGITEPKILEAFLTVERHRFVPAHLTGQAYDDHPLPIGQGQTISQPYIVAFMTAALNLSPTDKVLEVGTGSGYQAAILARLCNRVYSIEIVPELGRRAARLLEARGYSNVAVKIGDGYLGWPQHAPFDAIIVTCAPTHVPEPLKNQLKEGGRMIIPVGPRADQRLVYLRKTGNTLKTEKVLPVRFVPMVDRTGKTY
jgi:protein-L-isoaspartate(D-aspartate) O-methyltransferase